MCRLKIACTDSNRYRDSGIIMVNHRYNRTPSDHCVFVKKFSNRKFIIPLLYMDDMLIIVVTLVKLTN